MQAVSRPLLKKLDVAKDANSPYIPLSLETVQDRTYPLIDDLSFWVDAKPGQKIDPKIKEFLRYILSQEGQEAVEQDGKYLPLTAEIVSAQLKKLD